MNISREVFRWLPVLFASTMAGAETLVPLDVLNGAGPKPEVWVVDIPAGNTSVRHVPGSDPGGKQALELAYKFTASAKLQYLGIPNKVRVLESVNSFRFRLKGDGSKCSYGLQVTDAGGETHQFSRNTGQGGLIDFKGWKELSFDLTSGHETWGGDQNQRLNYPLTAFTLTVGQPSDEGKLLPAEGSLLFENLAVASAKTALEVLGARISVISPPYASEIRGKTKVSLSAPGFKRLLVKCWKQGGGAGTDSTVATLDPDVDGKGVFSFPADDYPHGPVTLRISGEEGPHADNCYLQLYNQGGVSWNAGIPSAAPPAALGMDLLFADDFNGPLSISSTDPKARYYDHKPPDGSQDFSTLRFTGIHEPADPFHQMDTYLRIRASERTKSSGIISSMKNDGTGITARVPCYFECRFIGPNAIGTWPAFWLLTDYMKDHVKGRKVPCDELDIIEAYGGEGKGSPNAHDTYMIAPHCWDQGDAGKEIETRAFEALKNPVRMRAKGITSAWFESSHTYGCKITDGETIYYCDDIEVARHQTLPLSKDQPFFFLINLATGGGWPVDLSRYDGTADMYVDYVRVYQGNR